MLTKKQIERQDDVDNLIHSLLVDVDPSYKYIEWNIEHISKVRNTIQDILVNSVGITEMQFYPYITEEDDANEV